jgi:N-acetyl sugar amidotransferase
MLLDKDISKVNLQICTRCIYDERVSGITFDKYGVCNYCKQTDELIDIYGTGNDKGDKELERIIKKIKKDGKNKKYDCVLGVSGGVDSSYMLYLAKKWGLKPLAVHYDNTWNTSIASQNISKMLSKLDIDLFTIVIDNKESDDIFKAFFKSNVAEIEASTDLALAETMYRAAAKYNVKYVLEGHSFITEGITPVGRNYFDGKYIKSIHEIFGDKPMKTYPLMSFWRFLYSILFLRIKKIRPFWYINYSKEEAREFLEKEFNWQYYGGHHLENRMTSFYHSYYLPRKFNTDLRNNTLSALVRNGKLSREEGWAEYNTEPYLEEELLSYVKKRFKISDEEFDSIINSSPRSWQEFPTYKKRFERLSFLFKILAKQNLVPMSFYLKYCLPSRN